MPRALIIVDVQNDFCEGGALAVQGGAATARAIADYLDREAETYDIIVSTRDWHDPAGDNGGHFSDEPDFINTWPPHCVAGTNGAAYHPDLWNPEHGSARPHDEVLKGQGQPAYSGFEGENADGVSLRDLLRNDDISDVDVVGIAFDYCVKATAIDAAGSGFTTRVLKDLTAAIHDDGSADEAMQAAGVEIVEHEGAQ